MFDGFESMQKAWREIEILQLNFYANILPLENEQKKIKKTNFIVLVLSTETNWHFVLS